MTRNCLKIAKNDPKWPTPKIPWKISRFEKKCIFEDFFDLGLSHWRPESQLLSSVCRIGSFLVKRRQTLVPSHYPATWLSWQEASPKASALMPSAAGSLCRWHVCRGIHVPALADRIRFVVLHVALWSRRPPNSTETQKELKWPKSDSKVTRPDRPQSDPKVTQKWLRTHFCVIFESLSSHSGVGPRESFLSHFWVTLILSVFL